MPPRPTSSPRRSAPTQKLTQGLLDDARLTDARLTYAQQRRAWLDMLQDKAAPLSEDATMERYGARTQSGLPLKPLYASRDSSGAHHPLAEPKAWRLAQLVTPSDPHAPRRVRAALEGGAEMLVLDCAPLPSLEALERALPQKPLPSLALWRPQPAALKQLFAFWRARRIAPTYVGFCHAPAEDAERILPRLLEWSAGHPQIRLLAASGAAWQARGADEVHELAAVCALTLGALRAFDQNGIAPAEALPRIALEITSGSDFFASLTKLRALRLMWAQLTAPLKCGAPAPQIHVQNALADYSRCEPWLNLLRATSAALAAGIAGCDSLLLAPHDADDARAERLARHVQSIVREESHIGEIGDAAAGSWYLEHASEALARAAWHVFQEIERRGGFARARPWFARACLRQRAAAQRAVQRGATPLLGVTKFVDLTSPLGAPMPRRSNTKRLAQAFETMRARVAAIHPPSARPHGLLVRMEAQVADDRMRFMRDLFAAGGLACRETTWSDAARLARLVQRQAPLFACLIGGDARALEDAETCLRTAKLRAVWRAPSSAASVNAALRPGMDMVRFLRRLHAQLGISETDAETETETGTETGA